MDKFTKIKLAFIFSFFLSSCALQLPPEGGEIDLVPPEIISTYPESGSINYLKNYFEIEFSEYVDKRSVREALFISPTIEGEMILDWSGKNVKVKFPKGFKPNTTYVITIGTDVLDYNNKNRMANSFNLTFSTGNNIDDYKISGKVYDPQADGTMIFAYLFESDTTNYLKRKADYISQCGKDGNYSIRGLPSAKFRTFAVKDQMRDLIFQAEQDLVGITFNDIKLSETDTLISGVNFYLTKIDTIPPRLIEARMLDKKHILLKFSEDINNDSFDIESFSLTDTSNFPISKIEFIFNPINKTDELVIVPADFEKSDMDLFVMVKNVEDKYQNKLFEERVSFIQTDKKDTNALKILKIEPIDFKIDFISSSFKIYFDDAIQIDTFENAIVFNDNIGNPIQYELKKLNDAVLELKPIHKLKSDYKYKLLLKMNLLPDAAGNLSDTTITTEFITRSENEYSGLSGKVVTEKMNLVLVLEPEVVSDKKYYAVTDSKSNFEFNRIIHGKYKLWAFEDKNQNGKYDFGTLFPFQFSEKFYYYPEIIEIKPRWSLSDLIFTIY